MDQLELFASVCRAFGAHGELANQDLYETVAGELGLSEADVEATRQPVGEAGQRRCLFHRKVRWVQQTLRHGQLIERVAGRRGVWRLTRAGQRKLTLWNGGRTSVLAYSTRLGVAILGDCRRAFEQLDRPVTLCITSPPYPLAQPRAYGNPSVGEYTDFICEALEPVVRALRPGGSVVLNVSNDIFESKSPARSTYRERLVIALEERLGLFKMDEVVWSNPSKPPAPIQWASLSRQQLNAGWEPVYWLTNDPKRCLADNRRVLLPHTERHKRLIERGGEGRVAIYGDGGYRLREHSFGAPTEGRIPKNVLTLGHRCPRADAVRTYCRKHGLPAHGAVFPARLAEFFIKLLTKMGDLVVDPMSGSGTVQHVAEQLGREWMAAELALEYVQAAGGACFSPDGTWFNPALFDATGEIVRPRRVGGQLALAV